jgi:threonylcarbamoyladenosine tRNA methylthiotransferase MtaB
MEDQVDEEVKNERVHRLISLSDQLAKEYASKFEGDVLEVIPEEKYKDEESDNLYVGYTDNYLKVVFEGTEDMIGEIVKVKMTEAGYPYSKGQFVRVMDRHEMLEIEKVKLTS